MRIMLVLGVLVGGGALVAGLDYYLVPLPERPFSPLHAQFAPTGLVGQGLGIVGTLMMAFGVVSYGLRKRVRAFAKLGKLRDWLHFHIFLCLLGPFLVLLHTSFKFGGLVAISFWCMALVVGSGVFGRWVYVWIPKTANGRFLTRDEIRQRLSELLRDLEGELAIPWEDLMTLLDPDRRQDPRHRRGIVGALGGAIAYALGARARRTRVHEVLAEAGVPKTARARIAHGLEEERRIEQQLRLLEPFQAAFRYWHAFHLPLAVVMVLVLLVHVGVAVAFGYTWIWGVR